jgi:signal transduction histidine kinase
MLETVERSERSLHELSGRLVRAEEGERGRISRELHDQIGQELTALSLDLEQFERRGTEAPEVVQRSIAAVARLIEQVRDISLILRPPHLDDLGLVAALREHINRYVRPHGIEGYLDAQVNPGRLTSDLEAACFRIAQEAITNVLRHAHARNVWVSVRENGGELVLCVRDDGIGFDVENAFKQASGGASSGLRNVLDRAQLLGGLTTISSSPGHGTEVQARLPLQLNGSIAS